MIAVKIGRIRLWPTMSSQTTRNARIAASTKVAKRACSDVMARLQAAGCRPGPDAGCALFTMVSPAATCRSPAAFTAIGSLSQYPPRHRVELRDERGVAGVRRGHHRPVERMVGIGAGLVLGREIAGEAGQQPLHPVAVLAKHPDDRGDVDGVMAGMPGVVVGDHGQRRVGDLRLAGELGLGHRGHADEIGAPVLVEPRLGLGRELRPFDHHQRAAAAAGDALGLPSRWRCGRQGAGSPAGPSRHGRRSPCRRSSAPARRCGRCTGRRGRRSPAAAHPSANRRRSPRRGR